MSEQTGPLGADERAELERLRAAVAAAEKVPYTEAAAEVAAGVDQGPQADAGPQLAQMSATRGDPLPAEAEHDAMMAEFRAMSERLAQLEAEAGKNRRDYQAAVAKLGPPEVATYGRAIHDKLVSLRNAHPDAPPGHFDDVISAAAPLAEASRAVIDGAGHVDDVTGQVPAVVDAVDRFVTRTHRRRWGKPIDFSALEADLEYVTDAAQQAS
jgi:hypothetical protein